jgi:18S rRNA (guanine1575-N7)-methyltransferase
MSTSLDVAPWFYYTGEVVEKNTKASHYVTIQRQLTERALEILGLDSPWPAFILDVGCGSAISGSTISDAGHFWCGVDVAAEMLMSAVKYTPTDSLNCFARVDIGQGLPFRAGIYDAAIGIDVLRWLFRQYDGCLSVAKRLRAFFESLHGCLRCGARAVFNFHPESPDQAELLSIVTTKCGFGGGIQTDFPNSAKAKINWLVLEVGGVSEGADIPVEPGCPNIGVDAWRHSNHKKKGFDRKEWILKKKERQRLLGKKVANDSKYTGRSRRRWI